MRPTFLLVAGLADTDRIRELQARLAPALERYLVSGSDHLFVASDTSMIPLPAVGGWLIGQLYRDGGRRRVTELASRDQLAIMRSHGRTLIETASGTYVSLWRGPGEGALHAMRDPSGCLPAFIYRSGGMTVIVSDPDMLWRSGLARPVMRDDGLAHYLLFPALPSVGTCLVGLDEIMPGELVRCRGSDAGEMLWQPQRFVEGTVTDPTAVADAIDGVVAGVVADQPHVGIELSGGLDSSIVADSLYRAGADIRGYHLVPDASDGDERRYARCVANHYAIPLQEIAVTAQHINPLDHPTRLTARPQGFGYLRPLDRLLHDAHMQSGVGAVVSGGGGDSVFCSLGSTAPILDAWQDRGCSQAYVTLGEIAAIADTSLWDVAVHLVRRRLRDNVRPWQWQADPLFLHTACRMAPERHPWLPPALGARPGSRGHVAGLLRIQSVIDAHDRMRDDRVFFPLLSQPVMETCLADPARQRAARSCDRHRYGLGRRRPGPPAMGGRPPAVGGGAQSRRLCSQTGSVFRARAAPPSSPEGILVMLALHEYRSSADRLADHLPWAALVAPGVVLNKDGSFQRTLAFRGPDLESATEAELVSACARANNVLKRFGSGWALYNQPSPLLDSDADNKVVDADLALQALGGDHVAFGYLTTTITVADSDRARVEEKVRAAERIINGLGFTCIREGVNAVEAWLSSLPGQAYANVRQPLVHTLNLAHLMPLSSVWAGPVTNSHLNAPALLVAQTSGSTPFRLSTHVGDVGHMLIVGPTGAGKSVLLALIALQFRRYPGSQLIIFDKGFSARAAVLAMGGAHHALGLSADDGAAIAFQPLRRIDRPSERAWAADWIAALLAHERVLVTPEIKEIVWSALDSLASAPEDERTLTGLTLLLQSNALRSALTPYTLDGPYGRLLDAAEPDVADATFADVQCFETEALLGQSGAVAPVLTYLFHRLEARFDGRPTLLILDEAWIFLDHPLFAARIREWLKTLRKKNVAVLFATQSLADISESQIAPAIIESCPQRILLPNDRAIEPQGRAAYARFGLNDRQIELISRSTPKRHYYLQSARGNRLFELGLGPIALALCGASDPASQRRIDGLLADEGASDFAARFLTDVGLAWAAQLLADFPGPAAPTSHDGDLS